MVTKKYSIPTMKQIAKLKWNGVNVVSTFSGAGGSCLGYRMAGCRVLWANEFVEKARETYALNHSSIMDGRDIRTVQPDDILKAIKMKVGDIDIFDGSPPCASFSTAGARDKHWGEEKQYSQTKQRTDDLFFEYARLVKGLQPKTFIAENVKGLVIGKAKGYFKEILAELKACGYNVEARVINAMYLGVPQRRSRLIFIGVRNDLKRDPVFPKPFKHRYTLADALEGSKGADPNDASVWLTERFSNFKRWDLLKPGVPCFERFNLIRPRLDRACPCIMQTGGSSPGTSGVSHPIEKRKFTIAELRRVFSFPEDFKTVGSFPQQWERIGRSVPPLMMKTIAATVCNEVLN